MVMLKPVVDRVEEVSPSQADPMGVLRVIPIIGPSREDPKYRVLDKEAQEKVVVKEVDESGSVPELLVNNGLDSLVYLMDGQELVGAKQNRILNTDVLIPAGVTLKIPVSCVESGRWGYASPNFSPGKSASHLIRSRKTQRVHQNLKSRNQHDADQHAVWREVDLCMSMADVSSPTQAMHEAYAQREGELKLAKEKLQMPTDAVGVAVFRGGNFMGLDLFDRHTTLRYFWDSLVDSYAIELIRSLDEENETVESSLKTDLEAALQQAGEGEWEQFDSPGEGDDYRLEHDAYAGSALIWNDQAVVHFQLFPKQDLSQPEDVSRQARQSLRPGRIRRIYDIPTQQE